MPSILKRVSVAANDSSEPIVGDANEFVQAPSSIEVGIVAAATGVTADVFSGSDQIADEIPVPVSATANAMPKYPEEFFANDAAMPGDRLRVKLRNTTGAAIVVYVAIRITQIG